MAKLPRDAGGFSALLPIMLAAATIAASASKLRIPDTFFGVGEALLLSWFLAGISIRALNGGLRWPGGFALKWAAIFALCTAAALVVGAFLAQASGATSLYETSHESRSWAFVLVFVTWFCLEARPAAHVERYLYWVAAFGTFVAAIVLVTGVATRVAFGSQAFWYAGVRFSGWSENPNQFAAMLAPVPFLALHYRRSSTGRRKFAWTLGATAALVAGLATVSDALILAWVIAFALLVATSWMRGLAGAQRTAKSIVLGAIVAPATICALLVVAGSILGHAAGVFLESRAGDSNQASVRVDLWRHGIQAIARSPVVGWGPGAHSGYKGTMQGGESHNTYLDIAAQAGIPVALALLAFSIIAIHAAWRRMSIEASVAVLSVVVFASFHNVLRHPVFWFVILGVIAASRATVAGFAGSELRLPQQHRA